MISGSARPFDASVLEAVDRWGAQTAAVAVVDDPGLVASRGPLDRALPWASVTKLVTACVVLEGVRRGVLALDAPAGPPGSTVRHLLAHASGFGFDGGVLAAPGRTRIYSNAGFDTLGETLGAAAGRPFAELLTAWVLEPLSMAGTRLDGRPSEGLMGPAVDLAAFAHELLAPTILPAALVAEASTVAFPGLRGVLPGFGLQDPNDWGLGFEVRGRKVPSLDRERRLAGDVRALRAERDVPVGRPGRGAGAGVPHGPAVRGLGRRAVAGAVGRGARGGRGRRTAHCRRDCRRTAHCQRDRRGCTRHTGTLPYQPQEPGPPLTGPTIRDVIQPP